MEEDFTLVKVVRAVVIAVLGVVAFIFLSSIVKQLSIRSLVAGGAYPLEAACAVDYRNAKAMCIEYIQRAHPVYGEDQ